MATDTERLVLQLSADLRSFEKEMVRAAGSADRAAQRIERRFQQQNRRVAQDFQNFGNQARTILASIGVGLIARDVVQLGDAWTRVGNALASAGIESTQLAATQELVADIALRTRADLEATADLFGRMLRSSADLGATMEDVARVTETVNKALAGASSSERSAAIRQLGQALGSGVLAGDELRSILENSRVLAQAIADEFGVGVGQLRELGRTGQLESRRVFEAILRAQEEVDASFQRTSLTVGDSLTNLKTALTEYLGTSATAGGINRELANSINFVAQNFAKLAEEIEIALDALIRFQTLGALSIRPRGSVIGADVGRLGTQAPASDEPRTRANVRRAINDLRAVAAARAEAEEELDVSGDLAREMQLARELRGLQIAAELARAAGDVRAEEAAVRRLEIEQRIAEIRHVNPNISEDEARSRAAAEVAALEAADLQGKFRDWFRGGVMAAIDGDLGDFFQNWLRERAAAGLEDALNQVADLVFQLFSSAFSQSGGGKSGGGSFWADLASAFFGSFGGGKAGGGPVSAGQTYMVGERGPELFRPNQPGVVIPNGALAGGATVVLNDNRVVNFTGTSEELKQLERLFAQDRAARYSETAQIVNAAVSRRHIGGR